MDRTPTVKRPTTWWTWIKGSIPSTSTDVVESRIVGDSLAPLLLSLPVGGSHRATVYDRFTNIHYVPLLYAHFKSIEINIRDDTGRFVPFDYGKVTVTLHFRRRRTGLF